jgi:hypothetical protein
MNSLLKKLNYREHKTLLVLNAPESFEENLESLAAKANILRSLTQKNIEFVLVFVTKLDEINEWVPQIAPCLTGDAILWMCYPKGTSKTYTCDFNRDSGWQILGNYGMEGVRMVSIDADWSALRFRKTEYIKKMTRAFGALSEAGKIKSGQKTTP